MLEAQRTRYLFQLGCAQAGAVTRSNDRADAGSGNEVDGDLRFFQRLQNSNVDQAAREAAAQRDAQLEPARLHEFQFYLRLGG